MARMNKLFVRKLGIQFLTNGSIRFERANNGIDHFKFHENVGRAVGTPWGRERFTVPTPTHGHRYARPGLYSVAASRPKNINKDMCQS